MFRFPACYSLKLSHKSRRGVGEIFGGEMFEALKCRGGENARDAQSARGGGY
jgi:hypothetical protein